MAIEVVTKEDLQQLRLQILNDIRQLLGSSPEKPTKPWLRNSEVKKLLNISSNTIQRLRIAGKLRSSKVGGIHYYKYEDIQQLLNGHSQWK
jgi:hypothetical protein